MARADRGLCRATGSSTSSAAAAARRRTTSAPSPQAVGKHKPRQIPEIAPKMRLVGPRALHADRRNPVREHRRADQRHGLGALPQAHHRRRLPRGARGRARPGAERRADHRHQHGRGPDRLREGDGRVPQPARRRARHRPRAADDRQLEVLGDRGRPQVRAGQGAGQLDLDEGGRGEVPRSRPARAQLWRRRGGDGLRREGPGRHARAQGRDLHARLQAADRGSRLPARGHRLRSQHLCHRDRHRGAQQLRRRLHRGDPRDHRHPAPRPHLGRRVEPQLLVPRQRAGARGDARGVPLPRHPGRHGHGHRQRRPARGLRHDRSGAARGLRGRDPQPPRRRHRAAAGARRALQAAARRQGGRRPRTSPGATSRSPSASRTRWSTASPSSSTRTPRRRGSRPSGRCTSSKAR